MSEETWQRAQQDSSAPKKRQLKPIKTWDCNLSDGLGEHLLEGGARAAALLKSMRRYLYQLEYDTFKAHLDLIYCWSRHLYSECPGLGLRVALLCRDGDLDWD